MNKNTVTLRLVHNGDFFAFGTSVIAYVKRVDMGGRPAFALHGADGVLLGIESSEDMAMLTAQQKGLFGVLIQ